MPEVKGDVTYPPSDYTLTFYYLAIETIVPLAVLAWQFIVERAES